ncbi:MAG: HAD family hydrolase [Anaerolineae bacterium]|nr:HAD family hydrolase [Anaerolineae bacterium]
MFEAVLFDLDDTLLRTETDEFIARYFAALGEYFQPLGGVEPAQFRQWVLQATRAILQREHPELTNAEAFSEEFGRLSGLDPKSLWPHFMRFYEEIYPSLGEGLEAMPGAREAVLEAQAGGRKVVVATNPLFPLSAVRARLKWAGLADVRFDLITAIENMHWAKPHPAYFREIADTLDVPAERCLVVGNDPELDIIPAQQAGMWTYLVCQGEPPGGAEPHAFGDLAGLVCMLRDT